MHRRQPSYLTLAIFNSASLFSAVQFHSAFAMGMKVNLLAANIQLPEDGFHGGGIYTPDGYKTYYYSKKLNETKLLVADLQSVNSKFSAKASDPRNKNIFTTQSTRNVQNEQIIKTFNASIINDTYTFTLLEESGGVITVCNNNLCCHLDYEMMQASGNLPSDGHLGSVLLSQD
jgi:pantetheine hydrolase